VLALNAAIQAHPPVKRAAAFQWLPRKCSALAERSGEATKQIGALVKTIQAIPRTRWRPWKNDHGRGGRRELVRRRRAGIDRNDSVTNIRRR